MRSASTVPFYLLVGAAAAVQNFIPVPITDILVLFAAFLMTAGHATGYGVFLSAWLGNVGVAAVMYGIGRYYRVEHGEPRVIRWMLRRHGDSTRPRSWQPVPVFVSCFLPVRPLLPIMGGLANVTFWRVLLPITVAAGLWYAGVVLVGSLGGHNFDAVMRTFDLYRGRFGVAAVTLTLAAALLWLVRRRRRIS